MIMFTDIEGYKIDLKKYYEELNKILPSEDSEKQKKELDSKFKDKVRKYLPTCLNIVNSNFNCKFSLYKEGKDYDASLKMVDTKVKKTKEEVELELNNYYSNFGGNIPQNEKDKVDLAIEILKVYTDEEYYNNVSQSRYLNEAMSLNVDNNSYDSIAPAPNNLIPKTMEVQHNPYAGQPIDFGNNTVPNNNTINSNNFSNMMQNNSQQSINNRSYVSDKEFANSDVIDGSSLSIFNNPNKG